MPIAITLTQIQENNDSVSIIGTLAFSGAYTTGGDTLDFTTIAGNATSNGRIFTPAGLPVSCQINGSAGYSFGFVAGTALNNSKVKVLSSSATEVSASTYSTNISGDTNIYIEAQFPKLL